MRIDYTERIRLYERGTNKSDFLSGFLRRFRYEREVRRWFVPIK